MSDFPPLTSAEARKCTTNRLLTDLKTAFELISYGDPEERGFVKKAKADIKTITAEITRRIGE